MHNPRMKHVHIEQHRYPGILEITAAGWDGRILKMSRDTFFKWQKVRGGLTTATLYALYAEHFERTTPEHKRLYVGQTGDAFVRRAAHQEGNADWTTVLLFTSGGDWMNAGHAKRIERAFIKLAKEASRYNCSNESAGGDGCLGLADDLIVKAYLAQVSDVLRFVGIDIFEPNPAGIYELTDSVDHHRAATSCLLRVVSAKHKIVTLLAGSEMYIDSPESVRADIGALQASGHVHFDEESCLLTVKAETTVPVVGVLDRILGQLPSRWLNRNRVPLTTAFKRAEQAALMEAGTQVSAPANRHDHQQNAGDDITGSRVGL